MANEKIKKLLEDAARRRNVPPDLLDRMAGVESHYNPGAVSHAGAQGLMQIMPATGRDLGLRNPFDAGESADAGARYIRQLYDQTGSWPKATAAYNFGIGNVKKGKPFPRETVNYQQKLWGDPMPVKKPDPIVDVKSSDALAKAAEARSAAASPSSKALAGYTYPKHSKLDSAIGAGAGVLGAIASLLGGGESSGGISPISDGGHGAAPILGGQSYNAGALQHSGPMGVSPYQSAILSLLKG